MFITNEDDCYFERNGIRIYYENDYRLVSDGGEYVYTSLSEDFGESHNIIDIDKIFDFLSHLNSRLTYAHIGDVCIKGDGFLPSTELVYFDLNSENYDPCEIAKGYIFININNGICDDDRIMINYTDLNMLDEIMDKYSNVFNARQLLNLKFVD